jgi:hypothetical protein
MPSRFSSDYRNLRPYVLEDVRAIVSASSVSAGGSAAAALTAHRLNDTTVHIGQLDPSQATWALTTSAGDLRYALATRQIIAGSGLTGGGTLAGDVTLNVGAGAGITVAADTVALASTVAGDGLTYNTGVINVGVANTGATGLTVEADAVRLTSSSNPGAAASVLASASDGALTLTTLTATTKLRSPLLDTAAGNLTLQPAGDITIDPVGNDVLPATNYDINLGALTKKYLTLHAAELWVETLVAQNTIATIRGRILVGPTTTLTRDLAAAGTTIYVKHNQMISGDRAYMEADGKVEFFAITSAATNTGTDYSYTVTRNLDGTGANDWYAGDAMFNTGQTGNGFIDLYSVRGVKAASQYGPTIVGNVRASATYNDWVERWAVGNLNGLYGYGVDTYGFAAGVPSGTWIAADATNGLRIMRGSTARLQADTSGNLYLNNSAGTNVITLDSSGSSYFAGVMTIGTSGEIRQGTGTVGSNFTGLRIWRDSSIGRIAGYNSADALPQWNAGTDGKFYVGENRAWFDANGIHVVSPAGLDYAGGQNGVQWNCQGNLGYTAAYIAAFWSNTSSAPSGTLELYTERGGSYVSKIYLNTELVDVLGKLQVTSGKLLSDSLFALRNLADSAYQSINLLNLGLIGNKVLAPSSVQFRNDADSGYQSIKTGYVYNTASQWYSDAAQEFRDATSGNHNSIKVRGTYLESNSTPGAVTGYGALWFDGTNLKFTLPGGTVKTVTWT